MQVDAAESPGSTFEGLGEVVEGSKRHKVRSAVVPPEPGSVPGSVPPTPLTFSNSPVVTRRSMASPPLTGAMPTTGAPVMCSGLSHTFLAGGNARLPAYRRKADDGRPGHCARG